MPPSPVTVKLLSIDDAQVFDHVAEDVFDDNALKGSESDVQPVSEMIDPFPSKLVDAPARAEGNSGAVTSRSYESEHDPRQMQDLLMQARLETDDWLDRSG